jgi:hypothetical protein
VRRLIDSRLPDRIVLAQRSASTAAYLVRLCRAAETREAREYQLTVLARANKVLAAYPRRVVTAGGTR